MSISTSLISVKPMNIVVADDDDLSRELVTAALEAEGHRVRTAPDGLSAYGLLKDGWAQVLISDWEMPGCDGPELAAKVRRAGLGHYVYIILLTGRSGTDNLVEGLRAGADDFLSKPFDPSELSVRLSVARRISGLESRDLMIFAMARLAESRDNETGAHLERTRGYCRLLAQDMATSGPYAGRLDEEFVRTIYATCPLHDIGKVGIPDAILLKPGKLTDDEFRVMQRHAQIGAETLDALISQGHDAFYLQMARDIAWTHHERFDGTGYPRGLRGQEIPLAGRIMALADVYDALRSKRVYKEGYPHATATRIITDAAGGHFDPDVVASFVRCEGQFQALSQQLADETHQTLAGAGPGTLRAA
jgi:putative two-component system response regulator